jgi:hypothetical protein
MKFVFDVLLARQKHENTLYISFKFHETFNSTSLMIEPSLKSVEIFCKSNIKTETQ